jgi:uncharacterized protein YggE
VEVGRIDVDVLGTRTEIRFACLSNESSSQEIHVLKRLALCGALACSAGWVWASQLPDYPFIHATGVASRLMAPNIGEIAFEVVASDPEAEAAVKLAQSRNTEILALLSEQGIPLADIEVFDIQKKMRMFDDADGKHSSATYDIKQNFHIYVRDLSKWQGLIAPLLTKDNVGNFGISFDRTDRDQINDELTTDAAKDAQHNGATVAAAFGKHLGAVVAVSQGKLKDIGIALGLNSANSSYSRSDDQRRPEILDFSAPGAIPFSQSVDVLFKIK